MASNGSVSTHETVELSHQPPASDQGVSFTLPGAVGGAAEKSLFPTFVPLTADQVGDAYEQALMDGFEKSAVFTPADKESIRPRVREGVAQVGTYIAALTGITQAYGVVVTIGCYLGLILAAIVGPFLLRTQYGVVGFLGVGVIGLALFLLGLLPFFLIGENIKRERDALRVVDTMRSSSRVTVIYFYVIVAASILDVLAPRLPSLLRYGIRAALIGLAVFLLSILSLSYAKRWRAVILYRSTIRKHPTEFTVGHLCYALCEAEGLASAGDALPREGTITALLGEIDVVARLLESELVRTLGQGQDAVTVQWLRDAMAMRSAAVRELKQAILVIDAPKVQEIPRALGSRLVAAARGQWASFPAIEVPKVAPKHQLESAVRALGAVAFPLIIALVAWKLPHVSDTAKSYIIVIALLLVATRIASWLNPQLKEDLDNSKQLMEMAGAGGK